MPHPAPAPGSSPDPSPRPAFLRDGDYATRFVQDAWAALPRAPWIVAKALFWYATRRRVRARNHLQEVVGRRLGFSIPQYLRRPAPLPPAPSFRCTALVLVRAGDPPERVRRTLDSIPETMVRLVVYEAGAEMPDADARTHRLSGPASLPEIAAAGAAACETEFFLVLVPPNVLLPGCTEALAAAFANGTDAVFADEVVAYPGLTLPLLKPDFDQDLLQQVDYVGPFLAARREAFLALRLSRQETGDGFVRAVLLQFAATRGPVVIGHAMGPVHGRDLRSPQRLAEDRTFLGRYAGSLTGHSHPRHSDSLARNGKLLRRHADERPPGASWSTHDPGAFPDQVRDRLFETPASQAPQDDGVGNFGPASEERPEGASGRTHQPSSQVIQDDRPAGDVFRPRRRLASPPPVTVVVPTRDRPDLFVPCLDGLLSRTDYPQLEVIVADNGSTERATLDLFAAYARDPRIRILPVPGPFNFSRINNEAVAVATGEVVVLMNNDVEVLEDDGWLRALVAEALRPGVGAVGPKLLYPNRLIQHAGVVIGLMGGPAGHAFHLFKEGHPGYLHMLGATRRCSAVTAACLAVRRETYLAHGGLDAEHFPVALNDVDFCLRLDRAGLRNLYVGEACLLHKESASRPSDWHPEQRARYDRELAAFTARWPERLARDPWYNSGHGQANADFSVPRWTDEGWPGAPC